MNITIHYINTSLKEGPVKLYHVRALETNEYHVYIRLHDKTDEIVLERKEITKIDCDSI